ncbi:MAG: undecaprenyl-diphosphate phosphatase [Spirochaetaceae bacterium]|nr:MAG: undecaprenyl-diphosphate phosphatase [Spirochaetaceae bacterium]
MESLNEIIQSLILGLIQGVTEFLPISSSGHLEVAKHLLGFTEANNFFTILLHGATLIAVFITFRRRIGGIIISLFRFVTGRKTEEDHVNLRLFLLVVVATAGTVALAYPMSMVSDIAVANPKLIGAFFIITAILLFISRFFKGTLDYRQFGFIRAFIVGIAQGLGIPPGISRSGITISAALGTGLDRERAGEFSFLLAIPAITGAIVFDLKDATALFDNVHPLSVVIGMAAAFVTGLVSIYFLLRLIKKSRLYFFSFYLLPAGILTIIFL